MIEALVERALHKISDRLVLETLMNFKSQAYYQTKSNFKLMPSKGYIFKSLNIF